MASNDGFIEFISPQAFEQLKRADELVSALADKIASINSFKAPKSPSGADNAGKKMADDLLAQEKAMEKARAGLQKLADAQKQAVSKRNAEMNAEWAAYEKTKSKEKEASDKLLATEIANAEKAAKAAIDKNNKIIQAAEKRAEREKQIEDKKAASIAASQQRQLERQAKIDERNSRTGANSAIPGMGSKIADLKAQEQAQQQAAKAAEREALANDKLNSAYNQLNSARAKAKNTLRDLIASESASNAEIRKAQKEFDVLDQKVRKADKAVGDFSKSVGNYKGALSGIGNLMGAFGISTGIYLFADLVKNIYQTTKQLQSMDLALKMVSGSQSEFSSNQVFLTQLAEQYGIEIKGLTKNFTEFWVASKGKLEAEQIKAIFTSISKSVAVMGLSVEQQDSAFLALQQMMSKGTVQAEELKKQLGNALPGAVKAATMAYQALHPELQVTEEMFMKQMKAGKVLSSELLPELAKAYEKLYGIENVQRAETLQAAQERLSNSWTQMVRNMNSSETGGISRFFKFVLDGLTELADFINFLNKDDRAISIVNEGKVRGEMQVLKELEAMKKSGLQTDEQLIESAKLKQEYAKKQVEGYEWELNSLTQLAKEQAKIANDIQKNNPIVFGNRKDYKDAKAELEETNQKIKTLAANYGFYKGIINGTNTFLKEQNAILSKSTVKEETEADKKIRLDAAKFAEEQRKQQYELEVSNIKREIERAKDKFNIVQELNKNELGYFAGGVAKKIKLSTDLAILEIELAQKVADEKKRLAKGNKALGIAPTVGGDVVAENEYATESVNIAENFTNRMDKINKDFFKSMEDAVPKDLFGDMYKMTDEQKENLEEHEKQVQKTAERLKEIQDEFRNYTQSFGQEFFSNAGFGDTFDFFLRMDEEGETMFDKLNTKGLDAKEKFAATFQAISQSAQEAFNFITEASQKSFDAEYERLEEQKNVALLFAGDSASARAEIEEQYEQRRKEIATREAKAKQKQAIFNIAIDTAQAIVAAVMKSPLTGGLPWSAIAAAIGAAQIAMVSSQQIPQYWKGTDNAEGGLAWTQEKGREIITDSQGRVKSLGSDKGAELTMLSKGDKVFTAEKSAMMFDNSLNSMLLNNGIVMPKIEVSMDTKILGSKLDKLSETIASKESFSIVRDAKGERIYQRKQNERKELLNNILNVKTYGI